MTNRALVLGAGGVAGIAWMVGVLTGLAECDADVTDADLLIGTSAGSVVATLVATGVSVEDMWSRQVDPVRQAAELAAEVSLDELATRYAEALGGGAGEREVRAGIGAMARAASTVPVARRRAVIESRLPVHDWPRRRLLIPVVDADSGEALVLDASSGYPLVDAVAASCAVPGVWPPVALGERLCIDGGVRSALNADLAAPSAAVLVLAPMGLAGAGPLGAGLEQARGLLERTGRVLAVEPDAAARHAIGANPLDPTTREPAARAGRAQAASAAAAVRRLWA
ncbi:MAG: patatin-like phospholipase family protein [Mycobacteriales bacterium]